MKNGNILQDRSFDDLRDNYMQVKLTSLGAELPEEIPFKKILSCKRNNGQAILILENPHIETIKHQVETLKCRMDFHPLSLENIYKIVMESQA